MNKELHNLKIQIFEMIRREFKALECADELNTSQGKHELWTPTDVALSNAYNDALTKVEKEFNPKEAKKNKSVWTNEKEIIKAVLKRLEDETYFGRVPTERQIIHITIAQIKKLKEAKKKND